jgi:transcriptional regulator with XRE-family HTH domain
VEGELQAAVGRNVRRVRATMGHSQEAFGEQVGWHRTFVGAVERGERNLTLKSVERISEQLRVHPLELLWDTDQIGVEVAEDGTVTFIDVVRIDAGLEPRDLAVAADPSPAEPTPDDHRGPGSEPDPRPHPH